MSQLYTLKPAEIEAISGSSGIIQYLKVHKPIIPLDLNPLQLAVGCKVPLQVPFSCSLWVKVHYKQGISRCAMLPSLVFPPFGLPFSLC